MGQINMPPSGIGPDFLKPIEYCQKYADDPLFIKINEPGFMAHLPGGLFTPDLPTGLVFPSVIALGPFMPAVNNTTAFLSYFDFDTQKLFITQINIKSKCPPLKKKKPAKKSKGK